ncbi:MAG: hypothetical protein DDT34_02026 [Firmicutes bacterium]|nr:hypothetical protein [Bacillota bacterium]
MNLIVNRDITIFERAQASSDDTWLVVFIIIVCCVSIGAAILERSKLLQRWVIESEVANRLRAKETLDKHSLDEPVSVAGSVKDAQNQPAASEATERPPTFEDAAEQLRLSRLVKESTVENGKLDGTDKKMFQVKTKDGRFIMIPVFGPDVPDVISKKDWIEYFIDQHDNKES